MCDTKTDCTECATKKAAMGKAKVQAASGYADHKGFDKLQDNLKDGIKDTLYDGAIKIAGSTVGYVAAVQIEEKFPKLKENTLLGSAAQMGLGGLIKKFAINDSSANGFFDCACNGMIMRGAINFSKSVMSGVMRDMNVRGILRGISPQLLTF